MSPQGCAQDAQRADYVAHNKKHVALLRQWADCYRKSMSRCCGLPLGLGFCSQMIDGKISKDVEGAYKENHELNSDEETLKALGYKQELNRSMSKLTNFAVSFTIISILTGISSMFVQGLVYGGPMVLVWGWYQRQTLGLFAMWGHSWLV
jgi:hypothetical protein